MDYVSNVDFQHWFTKVRRSRRRVLAKPSPKSIHDLRVAIRRCKVLAREMKKADPSFPGIKLAEKADKLFRSLGKIRDIQVAKSLLSNKSDNNGPGLLRHFERKEGQLLNKLKKGFGDFDVKKWKLKSQKISHFGMPVKTKEEVYRSAQKQLSKIKKLFNEARKTHAPSDFHKLRIKLKRYRYALEIFFPNVYKSKRQNLKCEQDRLGEIHDLALLRTQISRAKCLSKSELKKHLHRIAARETRCINRYLSHSKLASMSTGKARSHHNYKTGTK